MKLSLHLFTAANVQPIFQFVRIRLNCYEWTSLMLKWEKTRYCVSGPLALGLCVLYCFDLILGFERNTLRYIGTAGKYKQTAGDHYLFWNGKRQSLIEKRDGVVYDCYCINTLSILTLVYSVSHGHEYNKVLLSFWLQHNQFNVLVFSLYHGKQRKQNLKAQRTIIHKTNHDYVYYLVCVLF